MAQESRLVIVIDSQNAERNARNLGNELVSIERKGGALKTYLAKRGKEGEKVLVRVLNIMQGQRYIEICERNPKQEQFFYGWIANRVVI
ncbi:putative peptidoglycan-binding domain-containing protein [Acinetobacter pittii]|uniref:putative peptidoglycan-binding domain-containing protein n=1 Tax=Acinetobacter pittii TaxID=48296 RepID=UPI00374FA12D